MVTKIAGKQYAYYCQEGAVVMNAPWPLVLLREILTPVNRPEAIEPEELWLD